jgi:hypothetical protein
MTDREQLELAAKEAGYEYRYNEGRMHMGHGPNFIHTNKGYEDWNPLDDDGDALRLAVKLEMCIDLAQEGDHTFDHLGLKAKAVYHDKQDPYAATRRAIVRAAAEIGKDMK